MEADRIEPSVSARVPCSNISILGLFLRLKEEKKILSGRQDTQHNDIQHNETQHKGLICDTQHK
jgi:hypothetical protein